jgi:hypothetical protein
MPAAVHIAPMPEAYRAIDPRFRPPPPPPFPDGAPTAADRLFARALVAALPDEWSRAWYAREFPQHFGDL